ncbi:MAG: hypothetical protein J6S85_04620 [Methanobrevibacter sp.]|nr:hypothetical protein [Methanobrevibacter sp.]
MVKLTLEINDTNDEVNVKLVTPTKKQIDAATENERIVAQKFKDLFDNQLLILLEESEED